MSNAATTIDRQVMRKLAPPVLGLAATQMIGWGTTFSPLAVFANDIGRDLGLAREWVFAGITVMLLTGALLAPRCGRYVDRYGARRVMVTGTLIVACAMVATAFSQGLVGYLLAWMITGIAMPMMLSNTALPGLVQVVGPHARRAITALMLLSGLTGTVFLPFNQWLLTDIGWRNAYLVFAAMHICICLPLHWLVLAHRTPGEIRASGMGENNPDGLLPPEQRRLAFLMLATWSCTEGLITWGLYIQVVDVFKALGLSTAAAIGVWAIVGPCQSLARFSDLAFDVVLGRRLPILTTALMSAVLTSASFLFLLPFGVSLTTAALFAITMGFGHGLFAIARNTLPLTLFGSREYATYMGLLMVPQNIVNAAAPVLFAAIISRVSANGALWISFIAACTGCLAVVMLNRACAGAAQKAT